MAVKQSPGRIAFAIALCFLISVPCFAENNNDRIVEKFSSGTQKPDEKIRVKISPGAGRTSAANLDYLPSKLRGAAAQPAAAASPAQASIDQSTSMTEVSSKPRPGRLHRLGLTPAPPKKPAAAKRVLQELQAKMAEQKIPRLQFMPPAADNSAGLPPIGNQGDQGSCVSWACGYYYKTYQEGREHGWSLADPAHQFSPAFLYNQQRIEEVAPDQWLLLNTTFDFILSQICD